MSFVEDHSEQPDATPRTWPDRYNAMLDALDDTTGGMVRRTGSTILTAATGGPITVDLAAGFDCWRVIGLLKSTQAGGPFDLQVGVGEFAGARIEQGTGTGAWTITNEVVNSRILVRDVLADVDTSTRFTHLDMMVRRLASGSGVRLSVSGELTRQPSNANVQVVRFAAVSTSSGTPAAVTLATEGAADFAAGNELHSYAYPTA